MRLIIFILILAKACLAYRGFQGKIPNGNRIPHPCKPNYLWQGVGHKLTAGSGPRNPFGEDFEKYDKTWNSDLCMKDSDGDGKSNGVELGDPECVWKPGDLPQDEIGLSHPGVCQPLNSTTCTGKNQDWVDCSTIAFDRDAVNEPGVQNITLRFPETQVPNTETNYYCVSFEVPSNETYHLIATEAIIDTREVMHHMLLFGCDEDTSIQVDGIARPCGMSDNAKCNRIIGTWTVGMAGEIFPKDTGMKIGKNGFKKLVLQFHWNNPGLRTDYVDSSGMILYYTPNLRRYDAGVMMIGQVYLEIPPKQENVQVVGTCSGTCSRYKFKGPINIISATNHMHYLGKSGKIELYRDGARLAYLTNEEHYSYDSPRNFEFENPLEVQPGDEIRTTCVFQSRNKGVTTFNGAGTAEEMCFGFLMFYPVQNMPKTTCVSWKDIEECNFDEEYGGYDRIDGCRTYAINNVQGQEWNGIHDKLKKNCNLYGGCRPECKPVVNFLENHPCFQNTTVGTLARMRMASSKRGLEILAAFRSCKEPAVSKSVDCPKTTNSVSRSQSATYYLPLLLLVYKFSRLL